MQRRRGIPYHLSSDNRYLEMNERLENTVLEIDRIIVDAIKVTERNRNVVVDYNFSSDGLKHSVIFANLGDREAAAMAVKKIASKYTPNISVLGNDAIKVKFDFVNCIRGVFETNGKGANGRAVNRNVEDNGYTITLSWPTEYAITLPSISSWLDLIVTLIVIFVGLPIAVRVVMSLLFVSEWIVTR